MHGWGHVQIGNIVFPGHMPQPDLHKYSLQADEDESVPAPPPPKGNTVQGKPRNFLPFAPSWAKHPDYDRVIPVADSWESLMSSGACFADRGCHEPGQLKYCHTVS